VSSNSVFNQTLDKQIGLPLCGRPILLSLDAFYSTKNSGKNFRKFPLANGTDFSSVENDKPHSFVRLEFFDDFEV